MATAIEAAPTKFGAEQADPRRWRALCVIALAAFMDILDASVVILAVPFIQRNLGATYAQMQWVLAAYTLTFAITLITGGRLGDIFGRKRVFLIGIAGFTLASALSGLAASAEMLIAARVLQGAMAGVMVPQVLSIIQVSFPPEERGAAFGVYGAVIGLGNVAGPLVAALLLQGNLFGLDWRPIFLINLPLGVATFLGVLALVRESRAPQALRLDPVGMALVSGGLLLLLYPLVQGRELGWPAWTFAAMAASVPVLALFALYERRKARADGSPLVEMGLFRQRAFVGGLLVSLALMGGLVAFFLVYILYVQVGLGFSALQSGLTALPWPLGIAVASGVSVQLAPRVGRPLLNAGFAILALGVGGLILAINLAGPDVSGWQLAPALFLGGFGMGLVMPTLMDFILAGVPGRDAGAASGVITTTMQVGSAAGVAVLGLIFFNLLASQAAPTAEAVIPRLRGELAVAGAPVPVQDQIIGGFRACAEVAGASSDPSAVPASCRQAPAAGGGDTLIQQAVRAAGEDARRQTFTAATTITLACEVGLFLLSFLLVFMLPRKPVRHEAEAEASAAA
jgi:EmrB/QacA subfamily drug resistance transporter